MREGHPSAPARILLCRGVNQLVVGRVSLCAATPITVTRTRPGAKAHTAKSSRLRTRLDRGLAILDVPLLRSRIAHGIGLCVTVLAQLAPLVRRRVPRRMPSYGCIIACPAKPWENSKTTLYPRIG